MNRRRINTVLLAMMLGCFVASAGTGFAEEKIDFQRDVAPILKRRCLNCHNSSDRRGGLSLQSAEALAEGGDSGEVIEPGDAESSYLLDSIVPLDGTAEMPKGETPLDPREIDIIRRWITAGAEWPSDVVLKPPMLWSLKPLVRPSIPSGVDATDDFPIRNPIDAFVAARHREAGLKPSPRADRRTLIRRLSLDITGLPPSPSAVESFVADTKPLAYERLVDRLLQSPHYGEHWAQHWLDLARYADSDGYLGDSLRPWAWVYRDWVIDAINRDQPFDQFSIEQLAGDLLPQASQRQKIATGFHRNNLKNTEAGADRELNRTKEVVDRVATTGSVWLGLSVGCAECHDHKHDPISQREFYQLYAFFNNTDDADISVRLEAQRRDYQARLEKWESVLEKLERPLAKAQTLVERNESDRRESFVHVRGNYADRGERVTPATPKALHPLRDAEDPDRLSLADWLFDHRNPLTPRVAANRVWQRLFGVGIVATPDDFGTHGAPPTHPLLLDWLATRYRDLGWSRKGLIRTIVLSSTYQQSSINSDPGQPNGLLWRQNSFRMSAETVRDVHLAASGLMHPRIGGPGIHPPLPQFVTSVGRSVRWPVSESPDRYCRGMYIVRKRTVLYPMLTTFDAPDTSASCSRRERTNTPMQALTLLNDPVFFECAESLGRDLHAKHGRDIEAAIGDLFRRCLNRQPTVAERSTLTAAHRDFSEWTQDPDMAMIATARIVMNLNEFVTRD